MAVIRAGEGPACSENLRWAAEVRTTPIPDPTAPVPQKETKSPEPTPLPSPAPDTDKFRPGAYELDNSLYDLLEHKKPRRF